jgi:hypothetical protein
MTGEWRPIETAPKDGIDILVSDGERISVAYYDRYWWITSWTVEILTFDPTHWMPLPPPPGDE